MAESEKLVPKRRFKEFENAQAWEQSEFTDVFVTLQNNSLPRAELNSERGIARNIHYGDILIKFGECLDVSKEDIPFINNEISVQKYKTSYLRNGDIVIADAAEDETVGKCSEIVGLTNEILISGLHTIPCRAKLSFTSGYLGYYMNSNSYHNQLIPLMQGTKVSSISKSALQTTAVLYPKSVKEQSKIGSYFAQLDNLLTIQQHKLEKIKSLKSAYLSEMFPAEGERVPKRRFAGFTGDWEQHRFKDNIVSIQTGTNLLGSEVNKGIPLLKMGNIQRGVFSLSKLEYLSEKEQVSKENIVKYKDFLFNTRNTLELVGKGATWVGESDKYAFNSNIARFEFNGIDTIFYNYLYNTSSMIYQVHARAVGTTSVAAIYPKSLNSMEYTLPKLDEQKKIGKLLLSLDNLITHHQHKLEKLQNIKKAFLHEMFI